MNRKFITVVFAAVLLGGCASPCMKKPTVWEQKQCKYERRHNRDIGMFCGGLLLSLITVPNIGYFVLSSNRNIARWILPTFLTGWGIAGIGMVDDVYINKYPHSNSGEGKGAK